MDHLQPGLGNLKHDLHWRAVRLKESIEDYDGPYPLTLGDEENIEVEGSVTNLSNMDTTIAFFAIVNEILDILERELFEQTFIKADYRDGTIGTYVGDSRRDAFNHFDLIDDGSRAKIKDSQEFRNDLIHNTGLTQQNTTVPELEAQVNTALEAIEELEEILNENSDL